LSGAASTRVGNELGAGRPRLAWLNTQVSVLMGSVSMIFFAALLMAYRHRLGGLFSLDPEVGLGCGVWRLRGARRSQQSICRFDSIRFDSIRQI
jgi:hypothetical protein